MPIVKQLIELMGGSIEISSELGEGSTFVISIPFDPAPAPRETEQAASGSTLQGRRLLLVEDNDLNAEIAATILEGDGAYVSIVGDGAQAVEAFAANPAGTFDAILMDVAMPKMDGLAATRAIRALDRSDAASIPIIAMTGNAFQEDVRECLEAGMNAHIAKPIDAAKAERVITKAMGRRENSVQQWRQTMAPAFFDHGKGPRARSVSRALAGLPCIRGCAVWAHRSIFQAASEIQRESGNQTVLTVSAAAKPRGSPALSLREKPPLAYCFCAMRR